IINLGSLLRFVVTFHRTPLVRSVRVKITVTAGLKSRGIESRNRDSDLGIQKDSSSRTETELLKLHDNRPYVSN
ncbi:hypothetical protein LINGRAHAP2_LOCUS22812, partial [Linum grandiflorum]